MSYLSAATFVVTVLAMSNSFVLAAEKMSSWTASPEAARAGVSRASRLRTSTKRRSASTLSQIHSWRRMANPSSARDVAAATRVNFWSCSPARCLARTHRPTENESFRVLEDDPDALDGKATRKLVEISSTRRTRDAISFPLQLYLPNAAKGPVPTHRAACNSKASPIRPRH